MRSLLHRFRDEDGEEGAIAVLTAALLVALMVATSLAVDVGKVAYGSRDQQGATDRAALDSVQVLGRWDTAPGLTAAQLKDYAEERFADNAGFGSEERRIVRVTLGVWEGGVFQPGTLTDVEVWTAPGFPDPGRFPDGPPASKCTEAAGVTGVSFNAVCIDTESFVPFSFSLGSDENGRWILKSAIAALTEPIASISAGSTLATLEGGAAEDLLRLLLGDTTLDIDLVGHAGVAQARVDLPQLAGQLGAGTVDEFLDTTVTVPELLTATIAALSPDEEEAVQIAAEAFIDQLLAAVAMSVTLSEPVRVGDILELETGPGAGLAGRVDLFDLVTASLFAANRGNALGLDAEAAGLPVRLVVIEPPQLAVGRAGEAVARTAQVALEVELSLGEALSLPTGGLHSELVADVADLRAAATALSSCSDATGDRGQEIYDGLEAALAGAQQLAGSSPPHDVKSLIDSVTATLGTGFSSFLSTVLSSLLGPCSLLNASSTLASVRGELLTAVTELEAVLTLLPADGASVLPSEATLSVHLATATASLTEIACGTDPRTVTMDVHASGAWVGLPPVQILTLDLGLLGPVTVSAAVDSELVTHAHPGETFQVPSSATYDTGSLGLNDAAFVLSVQPDLGEDADEIIGPILAPVEAGLVSLLDEVLTDLDTDVVEPLLSELGLRLAEADVSALWVGSCGGRTLVR